MPSIDDYYQSKEFLQILKEYEASEKAGYPVFFDADDFTDIAEYYIQTGRLDQGIRVATQALQIHPGATGPLVLQARALLNDTNDVEEASKLCSQIADKTDLEYIFLKSEILLASEQVDMAEDMLRGKMNDIDDEDELEDYILSVANIYLEYGFPEQVADWLSQSHQYDAYQYREIKATLCYLDEKYDEAERIFNSLLDEDPYDAHIWKYLSKCQFKGERYNESISSCDFALAVTPNDSEAVLIKAAMMFCIENFTEALRYYRRFQELEPHEHAVLPYIAACFHYMGEREQYLTYLKSSCELVPEETNEVLHFFYPDGMDPKDYYRYELQRVENNNVEN